MAEEKKVKKENQKIKKEAEQKIEDAVSAATAKEVEALKKRMEQEVEAGKEMDCEPKLNVTDNDRIIVMIRVYFSKLDGKILTVSPVDVGSDPNQALGTIEAVGIKDYKFEFTVPQYEQFCAYRRASSRYVREAGLQIVDKLSLRGWFITYHLVDTDFPLFDGTGKKRIKLTRKKDEDDDLDIGLDLTPLSSESLEAVYRIRSAILELVLNTYEQNAMLNV